MMMKNSIILFLLTCASFTAMSQPKISVGTPYDVIDAGWKVYYTRGGEIMTVKKGKSSVIVQKMDARTLKFKSIKLYDDFPKGYVVEGLKALKDRFCFFYSREDGDESILYCRELDFAKGSFTAQGKKVFSGEGIARRDDLNKDKFSLFPSGDSTSLLIQYRLVPEKRRDKKSFDVIGMHVVDNNLKEKWSQKVQMPYTEKKMDILDYSVDSFGNVFITSRVFEDNTTDLKKRGDDDANYHLEVLKVAAGTSTTTSAIVEIADKFVKTIWMYETTTKGAMVCAGLYSKGKVRDGSDGIFIFNVGTDGKITGINAIEFPLELINQNVTNKSRRKNEKRDDDDDDVELPDLSLDAITVQRDGSLIITGEQAFTIWKTSRSGGQTSTYPIYYAHNIVVTKVNADGSLAWMKKLPKRQRSQAGFEYLGYRHFIGTEKHYFLFLDNEKNMKLGATDVPELHMDGQGGFLTAYTINNKTGEVNKELILNTRDVQGMEIFQLVPSRIMAPLPNTLVFEAYKKKKEDVLVKIEF